MQVRRLEAEEVLLLRDLRLRALSEAAELLEVTFSEAAAQPVNYWEDLAGVVTDSRSGAMFVAFDGPASIGCVYGLCDLERRGAGRLAGMWVEPVWRRRGVGRAMLRETVNWASDRDLRMLRLWAPDTAAALGLHLQAGFRTTGNVAPGKISSDVRMVEMEYELFMSRGIVKSL